MPFALRYCPVCNKENSGCKVGGAYVDSEGLESSDTEVVLCRVGNTNSKYQLIHSDTWSLYKVPTADIDFTKASGWYNRSAGKVEYLPHDSFWWQKWTKENYQSYNPKYHAKEFLEKRGLDPEQCYKDGFREITLDSYQMFFREPREQRNLPMWKVPVGLFIPCFDMFGNVIHGQVAPKDRGFEYDRDGNVIGLGPKYKWMQLHGPTGGPDRNPQSYAYHGTKPGTFWRGNALRDVCLVCEGVLKPYVVYSNLQREYHVYGSSSGHWTSNQKYLEEFKKVIRNLGVTKIMLLPDSNSRGNKDVWNNCNKLKDWCIENGFTFILGDWGQLDEKMELQDPDEIPPNQLATIVKSQSKPKNPAEQLAIKEAKGPYKPKLLVDKANNELDFKQWLNKLTQTDDRFYLLNTPMGTGKSWLVEEIHRHFDVNVVYISQSPRDLPTEYLARNAYVPPARHNGLVNTGRRDPIGNLIYRRPKSRDEVPDTSPTCLRATEHDLALKNGVPPAKLCRECPAFQGCLNGSDPDYTYLYDKIQGIKTHTLIATSVAGFSDKLIPDNGKQTYIIVDECSQNLQPLEVIPLKSDEFTSLDRRFTLIEDEGGKFIPLTIPTMTDIEDAERIDANNLQLAMQNRGKATQFGKLVQGLMSNGYIQAEKNVLSLICRSPQVSKVLHSSKASKVILMDATASKPIIEAELGITNLQSYGAQDLSVNSVDIQVFFHPGASKFKITPEAFEFSKSLLRDTRQDSLAVDDNQRLSSWTILGACDLVGKDGIGFFRDSRGSNAAQEKDGIVIAGLPLPNLGGLKLKYSILENPSISFNEYYQAHVQSEILQSIGRLRGYRRQDRRLTVRIVCNTNLDWLGEYGYRLFYRAAPVLTQQYEWVFRPQQEIPVSTWLFGDEEVVPTVWKTKKLISLLEIGEPLSDRAVRYGLSALSLFDPDFRDYRLRFIEIVKKKITTGS
jgi:hypothetical protein